MNPIAIIHSLVALVIIGFSWPLVKRKIKRNQMYAIRIPEAFKSEERWLEINQYGGRLMMRWGIVIAITAGIGLTLPKKYWIIYAFGALAVILVGLGIVITFISRYAARTKKS
jgi:intracellular septation protein A